MMPPQRQTRPVVRLALVAVLTSLALVLSFIERLIPLDAAIPGIRLGLGNVCVLVGLHALGARPAFLIMLLKVLLSGALFGSPASMLYAFSGGFLAWLGMALSRKLLGIPGQSVLGAALHNLGQILVAMLVTRTPGLIYYLPALLISAVVTGLLTGVIARLTLPHLIRILPPR